MWHLIFLTKKVGRNQNQGETSQGEMSQGEMSVREKCLLAVKVAFARYFSMSDKFLIAIISKIILVVMLSTNTYNISIATRFSFLKWYSNKKSIKN